MNVWRVCWLGNPNLWKEISSMLVIIQSSVMKQQLLIIWLLFRYVCLNIFVIANACHKKSSPDHKLPGQTFDRSVSLIVLIVTRPQRCSKRTGRCHVGCGIFAKRDVIFNQFLGTLQKGSTYFLDYLGVENCSTRNMFIVNLLHMI